MLLRPILGLAIAQGGGLSGEAPSLSLGGRLPDCVWRVQGGDVVGTLYEDEFPIF